MPLTIAFAIGLIVSFRNLAGRRERLKWLAALLLGVVPVGPLLAAANDVVRAQVDQDNPFFQPVLGLSLPVVLVGGLVLLLLIGVMGKYERSG